MKYKVEKNDLYRIYMPYCVEQTGKNRWVILNRYYKPIGFYDDKNYNYDDYALSIILKDDDLIFISCDKCIRFFEYEDLPDLGSLKRVWLYKEYIKTNNEYKDYLQRVGYLMEKGHNNET